MLCLYLRRAARTNRELQAGASNFTAGKGTGGDFEIGGKPKTRGHRSIGIGAGSIVIHMNNLAEHVVGMVN